MTTDDMRAHIEQLITAARAARPPDDGLIVHWTTDRDNACMISDNELHLPVIRDAKDYATALHELGHLLGRYQRSNNALLRERWAWVWARRTALTWTRTMEAEAVASLAWYVNRMKQ